MLNPGPGLEDEEEEVEEEDCEKLAALTRSKKPNTSRNLRIRNFS
jgi:hypothetical protein